MYCYIFFDLDGTLTDSKEGIFNCIQYSLKKLERPALSEDVMLNFIGPPLQDSFVRYCDMTRKEADEAIALYRERYNPIGKYENEPVAGTVELCRRLKEQGYILALASSKPEVMCVDICRKFGFAEHLEVITGSKPGADWHKADVIRETMRRLGLTEQDQDAILMVGDRKYDVLGAKECGIDCVGVEFLNYAAPGELQDAGAVAVVQTVEQLEHYIRSH
jgi:phosphoglycolate phosphatase